MIQLNDPILTRSSSDERFLLNGTDKEMTDTTDKYRRIKEKGRTTKKRHSDMICRCYEVKVDSSRMSKAQKQAVSALFREAKWFRNAYIADMHNVTWKDKSVSVKAGEVSESREIKVLGSQIRQSIINEVKDSLKSLSALKKKGYKAGALRFRSVCNSVGLSQYRVTYDIDRERSTIRVQNIKKRFKVRGLDQIPEDAEIANARFIRKASGLYFHITCFMPKEEKILPHRQVGIDFGIENNLVFSDGREPINISVPESRGTKLAAKRMNKALTRNENRKSNKHYKRLQKVRRAYEKDANRRKDLANKAVHEILSNYRFIAIQDEMIHNWHKGLFGRQVQHSAMGVIKAELKKSSNVHVVSREFPSTKICPMCSKMTKHPLKERSYTCGYCGYHRSSRDEKAAVSILSEAVKEYMLSGTESSESRGGQARYSRTVIYQYWSKVIACETGSSCFQS